MGLCKLCTTWLPPPEVKVTPTPRVVQELIVWDSLKHKDYQSAHVKVSPIPRLGRRRWMYGLVWTTITSNLPMSRYHPSLGWCRSWINGTVWTIMTTNLPISPIPRLAQEWNVWDSLDHNDYQHAHIKVSPIPRLVQELNKWDSLNHNDDQPAHVTMSRYHPSLGWSRSWINVTVWTTMTTICLYQGITHP
jgi:hypothetical protein